MNKKQWQKPELIVLVRGKPEEAVLATCKIDWIFAEPGNFYINCRGDLEIPCNPCTDIAVS
ncbi:MAG: hypothetical protein KKB13_14470 [Chloroflexi bacterium]|nr:hypothetical protein [Chloroflexota bacterium]